MRHYFTDPTARRLRELSPYSACRLRELRQVASTSTAVDVAAGRVVCTQGAVAREAFIVLDGEVSVTVDGREIARLGAGSVVGELGLTEHRPRNATVTATAPTTLLAFSLREFHDALRGVPAFAEHVASASAGR
jgi:CRP-like cAMP-binding protein